MRELTVEELETVGGGVVQTSVIARVVSFVGTFTDYLATLQVLGWLTGVQAKEWACYAPPDYYRTWTGTITTGGDVIVDADP